MLNAVPLFLVLLVGACRCYGVVNVDLGHEVNEHSIHWLTSEPFSRETKHSGYTDEGYWYESYSFCTSEHVSTHLDAPSHFARGKWAVQDIPLERLLTGQGVVVDIRDKVKDDPSAELTTDDLMTWMDQHGPLPDRAVVFVLTGWGSKYGNKTAYFGTDTNDPSNLVFPGINPGAAQLLAQYQQASGARVFGVGIDTASLDHGPSKTYKTHIDLFQANIFGLENVANLEKLPTRGFEVMVMPLKLTGGSGAPARVVARIHDGEDSEVSSAAMAFSRPSCHYFLLLLATFTVLKRL